MSSARVILVVDDEPQIAAVVVHKLRRAGYAVFEARDGLEAWTLLNEHPIDAVVSDLQMPRLDGLGLAQRMAGVGRFAPIPVVLVTGRGHMLTEHELSTVNIAGIIGKPFSPKQVVELVGQALAKSPGSVNPAGESELGQAA
jgi:two-component system chemotaxis response regulator CheY